MDLKKLSAAVEKKLGKMIGSASSESQIIEQLKKYFYSSSISLKSSGSDEWDVYNSKGKIEGCKVIKKNGRYRFEMI